ncbi:uncharacterized protein [Arachis hypogaea]|uniref:uncharacterized protein n=1 Tax=Arachis hypogaea TaxID=3818 RepID=UPI003B20BEFB
MERRDAKRLIREAQSYTLVNDVLYRRVISTPLLKCVPNSNTREVLEDVHSGMCGNHLGARALSQKVVQADFFRPTLQKEAAEFVKTCHPCQKHTNFHIAPPEDLISVTSPCPFVKWGHDLLGPFPKRSGQVKFLIVGVDYLTKWIKAEPLTAVTAQRSQKFLYRNIVTRFGVSHSITTNNGTHFTDTGFRNLVADLKIRHQFTSVELPQANG